MSATVNSLSAQQNGYSEAIPLTRRAFCTTDFCLDKEYVMKTQHFKWCQLLQKRTAYVIFVSLVFAQV